MKIDGMSKMMERKLGEKGAFAFRCMKGDEETGRAPVGRFAEHFAAARDWHSFLNKIYADRDLSYTSQAWGVIAGRLGWEAPVDRSRVVKRFFCEADAGSIKIGDMAGTFAVLMPNGYGDGCCEAIVMDRCAEGEWHHGGFNNTAFRLLTSVSGAFQVYHYDCEAMKQRDGDPDLDGDYMVYSNARRVLFVPLG